MPFFAGLCSERQAVFCSAFKLRGSVADLHVAHVAQIGIGAPVPPPD
jgi:hypothetical protein